MLSNICNFIKQNKNILMLLSALIYSFALISTLSGNIFWVSFLFCVFLILLLLKEYFPLKYILIWAILFFIGVANTSLRLKTTGELLNIAPVNSEVSGTIISIPQGVREGKPKFFFNVDKIKVGNSEKVIKNEKILVTINDAKNVPRELKIYSSGKMKGRLSLPFKAGNPSQFDYGNYLRNHNAYAVFYAETFSPMTKGLTLKEKLLQKISDYRDRVINLHSNYLKSPNLEILGGIVFGDDAVSPPKDITNLRLSSKSFALKREYKQNQRLWDETILM